MDETLTHEELSRLTRHGSISPALAERVHALIDAANRTFAYPTCPVRGEDYDGPCGGCRIERELG